MPQTIEEQQNLAACEISTMTIGYQGDITGKVTCHHHPQRSLTSINIECMDNIMDQLHKAFTMQNGNENSTSLIKE
jgi:hypothetical protein